MPAYTVLFDGSAGSGIQPIHAIDPTHAVQLMKGLYPDAALQVIPQAALEGSNPLLLLRTWMAQLDAGQAASA